jgi:hypothetical protein
MKTIFSEFIFAYLLAESHDKVATIILYFAWVVSHAAVRTDRLCAASLRKRRPSAAGSLPRTHSAGPVVSDLLSPI